VLEKHKAKKAQELYQSQMGEWQSEHDELTALLQAATSKTGSPSSDIVLKPGETVFAAIGNTSLVDDRRGAGHYAGHSSGFSVPVASVGGHSVRYRVGASKGHYVQGDLHPEAVDRGKLIITNQRVIFVGDKRTIECLFAKLVSAKISGGELALSVSNRQKVTRVHYGPPLDALVQIRLTLAMSIARGDADQFAAQIQEQLNELEAKRPQTVTT
jgi:hypothetical protein